MAVIAAGLLGGGVYVVGAGASDSSHLTAALQLVDRSFADDPVFIEPVQPILPDPFQWDRPRRRHAPPPPPAPEAPPTPMP
jgi:hypothetical protein